MSDIIRVGADPFPPYQYYVEDGSVRGIDFDTVSRAFAAIGREIKVELYDFPIVEKMLRGGEMQAAFQVQPTPEREKIYHFSQLLREAATELVTAKEGVDIQEYREIETKGLTLGVLEGYTNGPDIDALSADCKKVYPDNQTLLLAISAGEVDLGVFDRGVKQYLMEQNGITNIRPIEAMTFVRPLYVVFMDKDLRDEFDRGLAAIR